MTRTFAILAAALVALGLVVTVGYVWLAPREEDRFAQCRTSTVAGGTATIGGPFELVSETGETVTEREVIDGLSLVYFGYTFCPDICPIDLFRNAEAIHLLDDAGIAGVKPVFITIDPARDTVEQVAAYTDFMHPEMVGLTGSQAQVDAAVKAYRVYAQRMGDDAETYLMDHSSFTYLMAPEEGLLEVFRRDISAEAMAKTLGCFVENL